MPFLRYCELATKPRADRDIRGYDDRNWSNLRILKDAGELLKLSDTTVSRKVLTVGRCPGLWRTYYVAMSARNKMKDIHRGSSYFGSKLERKTTKNRLGTTFEGWIDEANRIYNTFLTNRDIEEFKKIPVPKIQEWFQTRAENHLQREALPMPLDKCEMDVQPVLGPFHGLPLDEQNPDGVFHKGMPGAVFESKIAMPKLDSLEVSLDLATYALLAEKNFRIDIDNAIVLHHNYPDERLAVETKQIEQSHVREVIKNAYDFGKLVQKSIAMRNISFAESGGGSTRFGDFLHHLNLLGKGRLLRPFRNWYDVIKRPPGLPETQNQVFCIDCSFHVRCFEEGMKD